MGITKKPEIAVIKLSLPLALANELRTVREAAERGQFEFSLEAEIAAALADIRRQLPQELFSTLAE